MLKLFFSSFKKFKKSQSGSVAVMFAGSAMVLIISVGVAIDFSGASSLKTKLQMHTDSAVLAGALKLQGDGNVNSAATEINVFLNAARIPGARIVDSPEISSDKTSLCLTTVADYDTFIMRLVGFHKIPVRAYGCAEYDLGTYEIALVLDTSDSMNETDSYGIKKIDTLKKVAKDFVSRIDTSNGKTRISMTTFSTTVNVGPQYRGAWFIDNEGQSSLHWPEFSRPTEARVGKVPTPSGDMAGSGKKEFPWFPKSKFDLFDGIGVPWGGCVLERPFDIMVSDTEPKESSPDTLFVPFFWNDEKDNGGGASNGVYNNYLVDDGVNTRYVNGVESSAELCAYGKTSWLNPGIYRAADRSYAANYGDPAAQPLPAGPTNGQSMVCKYYGQKAQTGPSHWGALYPVGPNLLCNPNPIITLTKDTESIKNKIDKLVATGGTNMVSGFMWGWRTLSPLGPFRNGKGVSVEYEPAPYKDKGSGKKNNKVIIFMSDGYNVQNTYSTVSYAWFKRFSATWNMDAMTYMACYRAKQEGIEVYTIGLFTSPQDKQGKYTVQRCATDESHYYEASNSVELIDAFSKILNSVSKLRISK